MKIITYITLNENCAEAIDFYKEAFGGTNIQIMRFGGMTSPEQPIPDGAKHLVTHAEMLVGESFLYFPDTFPGMPFNGVTDELMSAALVEMSPDKAAGIFDKLQEGGKVSMPM